MCQNLKELVQENKTHGIDNLFNADSEQSVEARLKNLGKSARAMKFIVMQIAGVLARTGNTAPHSKFKSLQYINFLQVKRYYKLKAENSRVEEIIYQDL